MSTFLTIICIFLAAASLAGLVFSAFYDFYFSYRFAVKERIRNLQVSPAKIPLELLYNKTTNYEDVDRGINWHTRLEMLRLQADVSLSCTKLNILIVSTSLSTAISYYYLLQNWWCIPLGLSCGLLVPIGYLEYRRRKRFKEIVSQLPKAIEAIRRAILSGHSIPMALQLVADEFPDPIAAEFRSCFEQQNLGVSHEACLRQLTKRIDIIELRILAIVLIVHSRTGGSLANVLENMAKLIRKRLQLKQRIRALTSEGRMQALVLTVLPFLTFAALLVLAPAYVAPLLEQLPILYAAIISQLLGIAWMRYLVNSQS